MRQDIYSPRPLYLAVPFRMEVYLPGFLLLSFAVQRGVDFLLKLRIAELKHSIEVDHFTVRVIYKLNLCRLFRPEHGPTSQECFRVDFVFRDDRQDITQHLLLSAVGCLR